MRSFAASLTGLLKIVMLETSELAVGVSSGLKHGGTADTEIKFLVECPVQGHGLHKRKVEGCMAAAAAAGGAGHLFRKLVLHPLEKLICLRGKLRVLLKNSVQFRVGHHSSH